MSSINPSETPAFNNHRRDCPIDCTGTDCISRLRMCVGLVTDPAVRRVALVLKQKGPQCVIGNLNGVGGKIEPGEDPLVGMIREFQEETGVLVSGDCWDEFCTLRAEHYDLHFFAARTDRVEECKTVESEPIYVMDIDHALRQTNLMNNLRWMLPLLQDDSIVIPHDFSLQVLR